MDRAVYIDSRRRVEAGSPSPPSSKCRDCGIETWFIPECPVSGLRHPDAPPLPLEQYEDVCDGCGGVSKLTERVHRHRILQLVGRMQHVQKEVFNLTNQPPRLHYHASRNDAIWPAVARLEREKTALVAHAQALGIDAPPVHPVPVDVHASNCPRGEAAALVEYNDNLKRIIGEVDQKRPQRLQM